MVYTATSLIFGLLELAKREGLEKVYVHCFLDGRDTPPASGKAIYRRTCIKMKEIGVGDRNRFRRVTMQWIEITVGIIELVSKAMTKGEGVKEMEMPQKLYRLLRCRKDR